MWPNPHGKLHFLDSVVIQFYVRNQAWLKSKHFQCKTAGVTKTSNKKKII